MASKVSKHDFKTRLRKGDTVMVIAGGNQRKSKEQKGQIGKILRFIPKKFRVVVEGVGTVKKHKKAQTAQDSSGVIEKEGSIHISNVMYYSQDHNKPVRLSVKELEDGRKVRGFTNPETKEFEQVDV